MYVRGVMLQRGLHPNLTRRSKGERSATAARPGGTTFRLDTRHETSSELGAQRPACAG
jgi:hypothetical protein